MGNIGGTMTTGRRHESSGHEAGEHGAGGKWRAAPRLGRRARLVLPIAVAGLVGAPVAPVPAQEPGAAPVAVPAATLAAPPVRGGLDVVTPFDPPPRPWLPGHRGVDLATSSGGDVLSPADGVVAFAGPVAGKPVVSVDHAGGVRTTYEPVVATVHAGDAVHTGDLLGHVLGVHPGCPVVACLHWGARRGETYLDPVALLDPASRPIRLLPLSPGDA